jgi:hypothetical protein
MTQTPQYNSQVVSSVNLNKVVNREGQLHTAMGAPAASQQPSTQAFSPQTTSNSTAFLKQIDKHHQNVQLLTTRKVGAGA